MIKKMLLTLCLLVAPFVVAKEKLRDCSFERVTVCEEGEKDGCVLYHKGEPLTLYHVCVDETAKPVFTCDQEAGAETQLLCEKSFLDACSHNPPLSNYHVCVKLP